MTTKKLKALGAELAEERRAWLDARPEVDVDERLRAVQREVARRSRAPKPPARVPWTRVAMGLAAAVAVLAAASLFIPGGDGGDGFTALASGAPVHPGERLVARQHLLDVAFSDGSHVDLEPGTEAFVAGLDASEVRLRLLRGEARVEVKHEEGRTWWLHGGEHAIEVVGTAFTLRYDETSGGLDVDLREGRVRVIGPCADPSVVRQAPVRFTAGCGRGAAPPGGTDGSGPPPTAAASGGAPSDVPTTAPSAPPVEGWRAARARGDLRAAFELASELGLDGVTADASSAELLDLALGARLAGSRAEALRLYQRTRDRFAGSDAAATAAFHLGRLAFDEAGAWGEAERWFSMYLAERPGGALAAESLGRSMEAAERQGAAERARGHAAAYLARFPQGPLATRAQKLLDAAAAPPEGGPQVQP